jgi:hypothetical protein
MKFAVLAVLFATADARRGPTYSTSPRTESRGASHKSTFGFPFPHDLIENVRVHYPAETVKEFMGMIGELGELEHDAE